MYDNSVNRMQGVGLISRKSVRQLEQPWLPVACARHYFGEEELAGERLWLPNARGFLLHIPVRRIYRHQHSPITKHGGRSEKPLVLLVLKFYLVLFFIMCHNSVNNLISVNGRSFCLFVPLIHSYKIYR